VVWVCFASAASAVPFKGVPLAATQIRQCLNRLGATSVQPLGDHGAGTAVVAGSHLAWSWIDVGGTALVTLHAVHGVSPLSDPRLAKADISRGAVLAARTCLAPYAPATAWYRTSSP